MPPRNYWLMWLCLLTGPLVGCALGGKGSTVQELRPDLFVSRHGTSIESGLSKTIKFEVGSRAQSLLFEIEGGRGTYLPAELVTPSGRDLIESASFRTRFSRELPGQVVWLYPNNPEGNVEPGTYRLLIRGENSRGGRLGDTSVDVRIYRKQGLPEYRCGLRLDFVVDEKAIHRADQQAMIDDLVSEMNALLNQAQIEILDIQSQRVDASALGLDQSNLTSIRGTVKTLVESRRRPDSRGRRPFRDEAIHVVVLRQLGDNIDGYSMGLPGPYSPDLGTSVVLAGTEGYAGSTGLLDASGMAETITHEVGHYLGLYHTSEIDEDFHDPIEDTPECSGSVGCSPEFRENLMTSRTGARRSRITAGQGTVIRNHPLCVARR